MKKKNTLFLFLLLLLFPLVYPHSQLHLTTDTPDSSSQKTSWIQTVHAEDKTSKANYKENFTPNPDYLLDQWNLNVMNIGEAWADGYTGLGIKIAILDTGFYYQHPDISMAGGYSVFADDPWSYDHSGHGTHIAGIISAKKNTTYQGIAPDAEVYGIKIYHSDDVNENNEVATDVTSVISGIRQAITMDVDIIVISSGLNYHDEELYEIIKEAYDQEMMIIAASGNGHSAVNYPAHYKEVLAITAVDAELNPALDIIYGKENEFTAPGVNIGGLSIPDSTYSYPYIFMSGSSQATPHAAGLAAIFMQKYGVRGDEARKIMQEQAVDIGEPNLFGHGLLYYQGEKVIVKNSSEEEEEETTTEKKREKEPNEESEDSEVRKPFSSREAVDDLEEDELVNYRQVVVTLDDDGIGKFSGNAFDLLEVGGTLELSMGKINSLRLTDEQIYQIRQNNHSIILSKPRIAWKIPPANFVPGSAVLRFYEGKPVGMVDTQKAYSNIWTTSIFQSGTRQGLYPGEMELRFELSNPKLRKLQRLHGVYFNKEVADWLPLEKESESDRITLKTRYTGAVGFFDPNAVKEEALPENIKKIQSKQVTIKKVLVVLSLLLVLTIIRILTKKK